MEGGIKRQSVILDAVNGIVMQPLDVAMTEKTGVNKYEFVIKYADELEETIPNKGYNTLNIMGEVK